MGVFGGFLNITILLPKLIFAKKNGKKNKKCRERLEFLPKNLKFLPLKKILVRKW